MTFSIVLIGTLLLMAVWYKNTVKEDFYNKIMKAQMDVEAIIELLDNPNIQLNKNVLKEQLLEVVSELERD